MVFIDIKQSLAKILHFRLFGAISESEPMVKIWLAHFYVNYPGWYNEHSIELIIVYLFKRRTQLTCSIFAVLFCKHEFLELYMR